MAVYKRAAAWIYTRRSEDSMRNFTLIAMALALGVVSQPRAQTSTLDQMAAKLGAGTLKTIEYSGTGQNFALGQSANATTPWPKFNVRSYTASIDYDTASMRVEMVRTQGENPPHGGGGQPLIGEQRQQQAVSGADAWNIVAENAIPVPAAVPERMLQIWTTPHGFLKAAIEHKAVVKSTAGKTQITFTIRDKYKVTGALNSQNQVERVQTWIDNPVLGDMLVESVYSDYRDFNGISFPAHIVQIQGGYPVLDLTVSSVHANGVVNINVPDNVRSATAPPVKVDAQKVVDGVYYLTGGSHHSVAVEMKDHVVIVEGPLNDDRSLAVIAKSKELVPAKRIKYLINTHQHFDHSGGVRAYVAEGATIVTPEMYRSYYEKVWAAPHTLNPDRLALSQNKPTFVAFADKHVMTDGSRTIELHIVKGNAHNDALAMVYLPKERLLIEADAFTPGPPDAPPPPTPNPFSVNLDDNIRRLNLQVDQILPIHGRIVTMADLAKAIGRKSSD
jgi:glyoxylase-like metal-dependent hydrolase (beta-lactamase superfamily II)